MRAALVALVLVSGCECGPTEASPPVKPPTTGPAVDAGTGGRDGGAAADAGLVDSGSAFADAGPIDLDAGDCGCAVGALVLGCGQSQCQAGQLFECQPDAGLLINEAICRDAGSPSTCRCDIRFSENSSINVPCGIVLCDTSSGLGRTCFADGGQAQVSCL